MDSGKRRQVRSRKVGKPTRDVFLFEPHRLIFRREQWLKERAPGKRGFADHVVQRFGAEELLGEQHAALLGIPNGQRPIADELGESRESPEPQGSRNDGDVGQVAAKLPAQASDQLLTVVEAPVPKQNLAGRRYKWMLFGWRRRGHREGEVEKLNLGFGILRYALAFIGGERGSRVADLFSGKRSVIEIPQPELHAHGRAPFFREE